MIIYNKKGKLLIAASTSLIQSYSDVNFTDGVFEGMKLVRHTFTFCNFTGATFQGTDLRHCKFVDCMFAGANFQGAELDGVTFENSNMPSLLHHAQVEWQNSWFVGQLVLDYCRRSNHSSEPPDKMPGVFGLLGRLGENILACDTKNWVEYLLGCNHANQTILSVALYPYVKEGDIVPDVIHKLGKVVTDGDLLCAMDDFLSANELVLQAPVISTLALDVALDTQQRALNNLKKLRKHSLYQRSVLPDTGSRIEVTSGYI